MTSLVPDFYTVESINNEDSGRYTVLVNMNPQAEVYKGHFPGQPIAPGVCLTQMVKEVANSILQKDHMLSTAQQIKFLAAVDPEKVPQLSLDLSLAEAEEGHRFKCTAKYADTSYFKISGTLS